MPGGIVVATLEDRAGRLESRLVRTLSELGFQVRTRRVGRILDGSPTPVLLTGPASRSLSAGDAQRLREAVDRGTSVALQGRSRAAHALGVRPGGEGQYVPGGRGSERFELEANWSGPAFMHPFLLDAPAVFSSPGQMSIAAAGRVGKGRLVYFGLEIVAPDGQVRFPGIGEILRSGLGISAPPLLRAGAEAFFDPALRAGVDTDELAALWASRGIRAVHVAGWYGDGFPYRELVEELHRAGLRAYLWLEPPMVTKALWEAHPACRERSATGAEVFTSTWRSLFALEDPACMRIAVTAYTALLDVAPWDGLDIAELYFEDAAAGPGRPETYSPFHPWVRREFAARKGFDPAQVFDPGSSRFHGKDPSALRVFEAYRSELITRLHRELLAGLWPHVVEKDVVLTLVDDTLDAKVAGNVGVDVPSVLALSRAFPFRVQVEDPFTVWASDPDRYARLRRSWDGRGIRYSVDINVVDRDESNPTRRMGGAELSRAVASAAKNGTVTIYAESTVYDADWDVVQASLTEGARIRADGRNFIISTPRSVLFRAPPGWHWASLDGKTTHLGDAGTYLVPRGTHTVAPAATPPGWRVVRTSCDVLSASAGGRGLRYESPSPCYVRVAGARAPNVRLDGRSVAAGQWWESLGGFTLRLPGGTHDLALSG